MLSFYFDTHLTGYSLLTPKKKHRLYLSLEVKKQKHAVIRFYKTTCFYHVHSL